MCLWIQHMVVRGSRDQLAFDQSPGLIAVFHALHRLLAPRHPPHALASLAACIPTLKRLGTSSFGLGPWNSVLRRTRERSLSKPTRSLRSLTLPARRTGGVKPPAH